MKINLERLEELQKISLEELIDLLAQLERLQWLEWARALFKEEILTSTREIRWKINFKKSWNELTEEEKDQDRFYAKEVLKKLGVFEHD